ncbi:hypothetical protein O152_gp131 [Pseudomonas phage PaBG]|uniref:Uncharacterized protein n=1 Tax=Pseudomonas phage PaBG TaxID=1335230 RepID=S5VZK9_9CAUD|nr:hypothetical protein O152_gp131 [Pseudomonas phage PaBG]AGS82015.1 hypothetical protein PaBG_00131 [Pseudomonas phage PaBG]
MAITKDDLKGMQGKRITIDGERHRVEKIVVKTGEAITEDGTRVHIDGIYKRGPGFFFDTPKKGKKAAKEEPTKPARARNRKVKDDDDAPAGETARQRRRRLKREAAEAEGAPAGKRARTSKQKDEPEAPKSKPKAAKKKLVEAFDQRNAEAISNDAFALLGNALSASGVYDVVPVAVGAQFNENALRVTITLMPGSKSDKEIKAYIREHREATDVAPDDDEDDDSLDDEGLDDDDEDDEGLEDELLGDLDVADLKKIARKLGLTTKKSMDAEAVIALIREDDDNDDDAIREAADEAGVELEAGDEDEDEVGDDDGELEDDEDDESEDEDEDDEEEEDESEDAVSVEDMVNAIRERAPNLSEGKVRGFVEAYLASDEIEDKFGDDMVPGQTVLKGKEDKHEFLLVGYDEADETVKLLNLDSLKFRSKSIADVARMEEVEAE